jgi:PTS system nitrogen regulatory IIA component
MVNEMLRTSLDPACVRIELKAQSRDDAIRELVEIIHAKHRLKNPDEALSAVMERERKMSTSLENEIALPHGKTDAVDRVLVSIGIKHSGIDFKSADGQPSKIIILMLSPASTSGPHVRCLAEIAKLLQSETNRRQIIDAKDAETIYRIMIEAGLPAT